MQSFPWNSIATELGEDGLPVYDRAYSADDLREVYETFFSDGVFLTQDGGAFKVSPDTGMTVVVAPGKCCIKGTVGWEDEERKLILQASASDLDRIDTVVLRWNTNTEARSIDLYVKTGVAAEAPKRPELTRNDSVYELGLADIFVAKETASIVRQRVTDTRMESLRCGAVTPLLFIDTTSFYDQLQAQTDVAVKLAQDAIDDTIAGNLQIQIDDLEINKLNNSGGNTYVGGLTIEAAGGMAPLLVRDYNSVDTLKVSGQGIDRCQWVDGVLHYVNFLLLGPNASSLGKPLILSSGGTGAKTAQSARMNLGIPRIYKGSVPVRLYRNSSGVVNSAVLNVPFLNVDNLYAFTKPPIVFTQISGTAYHKYISTNVHGVTNSKCVIDVESTYSGSYDTSFTINYLAIGDDYPT